MNNCLSSSPRKFGSLYVDRLLFVASAEALKHFSHLYWLTAILYFWILEIIRSFLLCFWLGFFCFFVCFLSLNLTASLSFFIASRRLSLSSSRTSTRTRPRSWWPSKRSCRKAPTEFSRRFGFWDVLEADELRLQKRVVKLHRYWCVLLFFWMVVLRSVNVNIC